jgi:hypothetical protein
MTVEEIVNEVRALSPEDRERLREALDGLDAERQARRAAEEVQRRLFEAGLLSEIKPRALDPKRHRPRQLIRTSGRPLSEIIVEERR